jgi:oligosaccharide repeat unit polymerase
MYILAWTMLFGYTLKGIYLAHTLNSTASHRMAHLGPEMIGLGVVATAFAIALVLFGYFIAPNKSIKPFMSKIKTTRFSSSALYFTMFGASCLLMLSFFTRMGFWSQLASLRFTSQKYLLLDNGQETSLGFLTIGGDFLLVFALYYFVFRRKEKRLNIYLIVVGFLFLTYFLSSRRNAAILMVITFLMVMGIRNISSSMTKNFKRYLVVGGMLLTLSLASAIRETGRVGASLNELSVSDSVGVTIEHAMFGSYFMDPAKMGGIITETRERNLYQWGSSYYAIIFAPIPRVMWSSKPPIRNSYFVSQEVLRVPSETGVPPSGLAELYLNFGWFGFIFGSIAFGYMLKIHYYNYLNSPDKRYARIPYALFMLCAILFLLADFAMAALFAIKYAMAIFVCSRFWRWKEARYATVTGS